MRSDPRYVCLRGGLSGISLHVLRWQQKSRPASVRRVFESVLHAHRTYTQQQYKQKYIKEFLNLCMYLINRCDAFYWDAYPSHITDKQETCMTF